MNSRSTKEVSYLVKKAKTSTTRMGKERVKSDSIREVGWEGIEALCEELSAVVGVAIQQIDQSLHNIAAVLTMLLLQQIKKLHL